MTSVQVGEKGFMPTRGSLLAAGLDLYASEDVIVNSQSHCCVVPTDIKICIREGFYGRIAPRSGLAFKYGANVLAGVIDCDYEGEIKVLLNTRVDFCIKRGDRIAQLIIEKYDDSPLIVVDTLPSVSERGTGGFGSTG